MLTDHDLLAAGTASADITPPPALTATRATATVLTELTEWSGSIRGQAHDLHQDTDQLHQDTLRAQWANRTTQRGRSSPQEMLSELADLGFAWRDVARLVGVSVPAIQKWRRGEGATGDNRQRIAQLLAACDLITENYLVQEVASWFEMPLPLPLGQDVPVTPADLWAAGHFDLVLDYASGHADTEQLLTSWDPQWRERYRSDYEVFIAGDGQRSIRLKDR